MLKQDLPHLSHLGVRARQERVPFATCTCDDAISRDLKPLVGSPVRLTVSPDGVSIAEVESAELDNSSASSSTKSSSNGGSAAGAAAAKVRRSNRPRVFDLADADVATSGSKAAACGRLAALAAQKSAAFSAPAGAVLPFGCMEATVDAAGVKREFQACLKTLETAEVGPELDAACDEIQTLLRTKCYPGQRLMAQLHKIMGDAKIVIARSSANVEDLEGLSGAGLYDSIPNLDADDVLAMAGGVAEVWASLFSRRAVLSRRAAGIAQADACMAVLVQVRTTGAVTALLLLVCHCCCAILCCC